MMRNQRDGTFRDVTAETGLNKNNTRYSFCCGWSDYNRDGWPDLYVVNDFGRKNLYRNNGDGTFTDVAAQAGVEDVGAGMSVCWFDYDNDGAEDLYVADMWTAAGMRISNQEVFQKDAPASSRPLSQTCPRETLCFMLAATALFKTQAHPQESRWDAGLGHATLGILTTTDSPIFTSPTAWCPAPRAKTSIAFFGGRWSRILRRRPAVPRYEQGWNAINELVRSDRTLSGYERNIFYANNHDGTFSDVSGAVGLDFIEDGRAFALADFDHDGRLEVFLKNRNGPQLRLLHNVTKNLPPSISFRLRGGKSNRDAIGAAITVETTGDARPACFKRDQGFFPNIAKKYSSGWERQGTGASLHPLAERVGARTARPSAQPPGMGQEGSEPSRIEAFQNADGEICCVDQLPHLLRPRAESASHYG